MIRLSALFWLVLVSATGFAMFAIKYEVQAVADQLAQTTNRADDAERDIRVFDAEWAYLNRPDALAQMNQRYLSLAPIATKQLIANIADIPMRPAPPPVVQTAAAVAENSQPQNSSSAANPPLAEQPTQGQASTESAGPFVTVALETRNPTPEPARPAPTKAAAHPNSANRAKSLDDLIAQIAESR